jgi:polyisoprenoid-binding protein YceI
MAAAAQAARPIVGSWEVDAPHSSIGFVVHHLGGLGAVRGGFTDYDASIEIAEDFAASRLEATIRAGNLSTLNAGRDEHLRDRILDVAHYPEIRFRSTRLALDVDRIRIDGALTVRGKTRPIVLEGTMTPGVDRGGYERLYFEVRGRIDTSEFIEGRSDDLELTLEVSGWRAATS